MPCNWKPTRLNLCILCTTRHALSQPPRNMLYGRLYLHCSEYMVALTKPQMLVDWCALSVRRSCQSASSLKPGASFSNLLPFASRTLFASRESATFKGKITNQAHMRCMSSVCNLLPNTNNRVVRALFTVVVVVVVELVAATAATAVVVGVAVVGLEKAAVGCSST